MPLVRLIDIMDDHTIFMGLYTRISYNVIELKMKESSFFIPYTSLFI